MAQFIVEAKEISGSWYLNSSHSDEYAATSYAERCKSANPQRSYRVVDSNGSVRFIL